MQLLLDPANAVGVLSSVRSGRLRVGWPLRRRRVALGDPGGSWSKKRDVRAAASRPRRAGPGPGAAGQVGAAGVAEVADPVHVRVDRVAASSASSTANTSSPTTSARPPGVPGAPRRRSGVEGQRDVVVVEPADERPAARPLAGAAAVEPEAARVAAAATSRKHGRRVVGSSATRGSSRPARRRARERIDSGWNCTPSSGQRRGARTPITTPLALVGAVTSRHVGQLDRGQRVVAHRRRRPAAARRRRPSPSCCTAATSPWAGSTRSTVPPYAVTRPCMPRQTPSTGTVPARSTSRPTAKSRRVGRVPGPGESTTCE